MKSELRIDCILQKVNVFVIWTTQFDVEYKKGTGKRTLMFDHSWMVLSNLNSFDHSLGLVFLTPLTLDYQRQQLVLHILFEENIGKMSLTIFLRESDWICVGRYQISQVYFTLWIQDIHHQSPELLDFSPFNARKSKELLDWYLLMHHQRNTVLNLHLNVLNKRPSWGQHIMAT